MCISDEMCFICVSVLPGRVGAPDRVLRPALYVEIKCIVQHIECVYGGGGWPGEASRGREGSVRPRGSELECAGTNWMFRMRQAGARLRKAVRWP